MNYILSALVLALCGVIVQRDYVTWKQLYKYDQSRQEERQQWHEERQQLLDRIQSPTFSEYKHQEAKIIKAKNGTDKPDIVIEQL